MTARQGLTVVGQVVGAYLTAGSAWGAAIGGQIGPAVGSTLDGPESTWADEHRQRLTIGPNADACTAVLPEAQ